MSKLQSKVDAVKGLKGDKDAAKLKGDKDAAKLARKKKRDAGANGDVSHRPPMADIPQDGAWERPLFHCYIYTAVSR